MTQCSTCIWELIILDPDGAIHPYPDLRGDIPDESKNVSVCVRCHRIDVYGQEEGDETQPLDFGD